jgi:GTP-binding protein
MAQRDDRKRLGKKHRQASTRPKQGRAPRTTPTTGAVTGKAAPRKRKSLATKRATLAKQKRTPTRSPEHESHKIVSKQTPSSPKRKVSRTQLPTDNLQPATPQLPAESPAETRAWREAEILAAQLDLAADSAASRALPLIAICGRPNVGKSTLFNRLTGSRRSIVGDEPGITRDRIYGRIEWQSADARLVDTGGIVPDDPDLIPAEIFLQARTALAEAAVIIMVVDGRTELASPDIALARLLLRGGKPTILAVNKIDTTALAPAAENFRRLGFRNVLAISAEHGTGIGDLLDEVFAALPAAVTPKNVPPVAFLTEADELDEDATGPDFAPLTGSVIPAQPLEAVILAKPESPYLSSTDNLQPATDNRPRRLRSHGAFVEHETKIAIIGRPNVGKSTLLNALTGSARAIVSPIAGTTRDAVDEVVTRAGHDFRFVDTAGIRRKGKTKLMAEKLSVIMARKHLEAADVSLLVLDATDGVSALDANIGGYAHESGRSVIIVINKWDLVTHPATNNPTTNSNPNTSHPAPGHPQSRVPEPAAHKSPGAPSIAAFGDGWDAKNSAPKADPKLFEQQVRDHLKFLDYAPLVFVSATTGAGVEALFKKVELVARERRKRVTTGQMNRFLADVDFQRASVPMNRRVKIYYMTQAAVAPPTFVLFTDRDVRLHFAFERFLANQIRAAFGFIGAPIWFKLRPRIKKISEE